MRRPRLYLRTLLIVVAVVGLALGGWQMWRRRKYCLERAEHYEVFAAIQRRYASAFERASREPSGGTGNFGIMAERRHQAADRDLRLADAYRHVAPKYAPGTVNTDGWRGTRAAWKALFRRVVILQCFLHAWLKVRDRAKHLGTLFAEVSRRVWEAYHAPDRRRFGQRLRSLRRWATGHLCGVVLEKVVDLCEKRPRWSIAYRHPGGYRTSNGLDRQMRGMNRYFDRGQHLHGSRGACRLHCRAWALLGNFAPWHPATARENQGRRCPAERLNRHRYHECWLQNLLISASLVSGLKGTSCLLPSLPRQSERAPKCPRPGGSNIGRKTRDHGPKPASRGSILPDANRRTG